jgi:hypothetical protein
MESRLFSGSRFWQSNVSGAALAGLGFILLLTVVGIIALWMSGARLQVVLVFGFIFIYLVGILLAGFPGNLIAYYPFAIEVRQEGTLCLFAPFKKIIIPIEVVRDIRNSLFQGGYVVRLTHRHGLLTRFVIHWWFGSEREPLARAIQDAINRRSR